MTNKNPLSVETLVADHLENKCISLIDGLEELNLDIGLAEDLEFCQNLDFHIICCVDCAYWYLPCMFHENNKGEDVCEECEPSTD